MRRRRESKLEIAFETHATTTDNERWIASGWLDGQLSTLGRRQAKELGDRHAGCALEYGKAGDVKTATVNFLSEKCNAYRYTLKRKTEDGTAILAFQASENIPNTGCEFIPEYRATQAEWHLSMPGAQ